MSNHSSGFVHDHEVVRWVATQLPNLPHIQEHLRHVADGLEKDVKEAEEGLVSGAKVAGSVAVIGGIEAANVVGEGLGAISGE